MSRSTLQEDASKMDFKVRNSLMLILLMEKYYCDRCFDEQLSK